MVVEIMLQNVMRGFVCMALQLGSFGLAACGSVTSEDAGTDGVSPPSLCSAPSNPPTATVVINLFADAEGRSGPDNTCPKVGMSFTTSNPQYVFCRHWGGLFSGSQGYNHYWIWTELDSPLGAPAWISAYYIQGQGNDQADGIPDCP
jgi:hypothetical protein